MRRQAEPPITNGGSPREIAGPAPAPAAAVAHGAPAEQEVVLDELLVEDVSIDGMCGVY